MNIKELVGKNAIRTGPVDYGNGRKDYSYTADMLLILAATETHIVIEHTDSFLNGKRSILDSRWLDDNWGDYDELMKLADETKRVLPPEHVKSEESDDKDTENETDEDVVLN